MYTCLTDLACLYPPQTDRQTDILKLTFPSNQSLRYKKSSRGQPSPNAKYNRHLEKSKACEAEVQRRQLWENENQNQNQSKRKSYRHSSYTPQKRRNISATGPMIAAGRPSGKGLHLLGLKRSRPLPRGHLPGKHEISRSKVVGSARKVGGRYLEDWEWQKMCGHCDLPKVKKSRNRSVQATSYRGSGHQKGKSQRSYYKGNRGILGC